MKISLAVILFFIPFSLFGQSPTKREVFEWGVDLINVEMIKISIENYKGDRYLKEEYKKLGNISPAYVCLEDVHLERKRDFLKKNNLGKAEVLSHEIERVKRLYTDSLSKREIIKMLTIDIFNAHEYEIPRLYHFNQNYNNILKERIDTLISPLLNDCFSLDFRAEKNIIAYNNSTQLSSKSFLTVEKIVISLIAISFFIVLALFTIGGGFDMIKTSLQNFIQNIFSKRKKKKQQFTFEEKITKQDLDYGQFFETDEVIEKSISNEVIENKIEKKSISLEISNLASKTIEEITIQETKAPTVTKIPKTPFYLSNPRKKDGSFNNSTKRKQFIKGESIYEFQYTNAEKTKAKFHFFDEPDTVKNAIRAGRVILLVCESLNSSTESTKRIVTAVAGLAKLNPQTNRWEITQKAQIRYE